MKIALLGNILDPHSTENHHHQALTDLGHQVIAMQERETSASRIYSQARDAEMLVWVHTHGWQTPGGIGPAIRELKRSRTRIVSYHLDLWHGLAREKQLDDPDYYINLLDTLFTVDPQMADRINRTGTTRAHYLPAAVSHRECWMSPHQKRDLDVLFVGSHRYHHEWPHRNRLLLALTERYGAAFHVVPGKNRPVRGAALNRLYGRSRVVVGDSLCPGYTYRGYWSDRVYETLGRGGMLVHPRVPGLDQHFTDGQHLAFYDYNDLPGMFDTIDRHLADTELTERIRAQGHAEVHAQHTYLHRWQHILDTLFPA